MNMSHYYNLEKGTYDLPGITPIWNDLVHLVMDHDRVARPRTSG